MALEHPPVLSDDAVLCLRALWNMKDGEPIDGLYFTQAVTQEMTELERRASLFSFSKISGLLFQLKTANLITDASAYYQDRWLVDVNEMFAKEAEETIRALLDPLEEILPPPSSDRSRISLLANRSAW